MGPADSESPEEAGPAHSEAPALEVAGAYTAEAFYNAHGGIREGAAHLHNLQISASVDAERLTGIAGLQGYIDILGTSGGSVQDLAGDAQGASNIEAPRALRLFEAWVQKGWERGSLLVGLYDVNRDFYVAETAGLFLNSAQGIGPEVAGSGRNGPSIFPVTSLGARAELGLGESTYGRIAILDGVPGNPEDETAFLHLAWKAEEGALMIAEVGVGELESSASPFRMALGAWRYTASFSDPLLPAVLHDGAFGAYLLGEIQIARVDSDRSLNAFARAGYADEQAHILSRSWGAGLVYTGLLPGRAADQLGFAAAGAVPNSRFDTVATDGDAPSHKELAFELTYRTALGSSLHLQPDLQYILHPGMGSEVTSCLLLGLRADLTF